MPSLTSAELGERLVEFLRAVREHEERFIITHEGREIAALVPLVDFRLLEKFEEEAEDRFDAQEAEKALHDPGNRVRIPWEKIKNELDL